eukprot:scaffold306731_cov49-Prasinocladus_malaysianus.AAC.1
MSIAITHKLKAICPTSKRPPLTSRPGSTKATSRGICGRYMRSFWAILEWTRRGRRYRNIYMVALRASAGHMWSLANVSAASQGSARNAGSAQAR